MDRRMQPAAGPSRGGRRWRIALGVLAAVLATGAVALPQSES